MLIYIRYSLKIHTKIDDIAPKPQMTSYIMKNIEFYNNSDFLLITPSHGVRSLCFLQIRYHNSLHLANLFMVQNGSCHQNGINKDKKVIEIRIELTGNEVFRLFFV
ncbi:hypothetical protein DMUE_4778 [Dictyocoela muelleri]|nr:hypothetical protein DMUE_4778 [Dictyocoela muelleri]